LHVRSDWSALGKIYWGKSGLLLKSTGESLEFYWFYHHPEAEDGRDRPKEIHSYEKSLRHHAVMAAYGSNEPWKRLKHYYSDGDPQNNHIENLKIATAQSDATIKQVRNHRRTSSRKNDIKSWTVLVNGMSLLKYKEDERWRSCSMATQIPVHLPWSTPPLLIAKDPAQQFCYLARPQHPRSMNSASDSCSA